MRADLLHAQASVDWAVSQLPSFQQRMDAWIDLNFEVTLRQFETQPPLFRIVGVERNPIPLSFNVEVGAYINALRSALDLLATALAERYCIPNPDRVYFPIARSASDFATGNYKGNKFVERLPAAERAIVESLQPYVGGNNLLCTLHELDTLRKHRRLLSTEVVPRSYLFDIRGVIGAPGSHKTEHYAVMAYIRSIAPEREVQLTPYIEIKEAVTGGKPAVPALNEFASLATSIVTLFDSP